jgi:hypothetical protein
MAGAESELRTLAPVLSQQSAPESKPQIDSNRDQSRAGIPLKWQSISGRDAVDRDTLLNILSGYPARGLPRKLRRSGEDIQIAETDVLAGAPWAGSVKPLS